MMKCTVLEYLKMIGARWRVLLGFCPLCSSNAPSVYDCPLCDGYQSASGDEWPPSRRTKAVWLGKYLDVLRAQKNLKDAVKASRKKRKSTS